MKRCHTCGRTHTPAQWRALFLKGIQKRDARNVGARLELRNCLCGSTLAVKVSLDTGSITIYEKEEPK